MKELEAAVDKLHKCIAALIAAQMQQQRPEAEEALPRKHAMPVLSSQAAEGAGPGGEALPVAMRVLIYGQLARLT
eukprot:4424596-Pleurochrysis_carterae.AAC.1